MHTKDMLAEALRSVGLTVMAARAAEGYYHDFLSPLALPEMQLVGDLKRAADLNPAKRGEILALRQRVMSGDFDASKEESDEWAKSAEGQEALGSLLRRGKGDAP